MVTWVREHRVRRGERMGEGERCSREVASKGEKETKPSMEEAVNHGAKRGLQLFPPPAPCYKAAELRGGVLVLIFFSHSSLASVYFKVALRSGSFCCGLLFSVKGWGNPGLGTAKGTALQHSRGFSNCSFP